MKNVAVIKKVKFISLLVVLILFANCSYKKHKQNMTSLNTTVEYIDSINNGLKLIQSKCYSCHSISSSSHDEIIAPPLVAVKRRYLRSYSEKESFVSALSEWLLEPKQETALMRGAVSKFKVMPNLHIDKQEAQEIATFIYDNELEKPSWFQEHFNQQHQSRRGRGNGQGRGMNRF